VVEPGCRWLPERETRGSREIHLLNVVKPPYLRVALTYMLISMPHGTSTIFGAFQAIVALLMRIGRVARC
jgi:hypothetical protein